MIAFFGCITYMRKVYKEYKERPDGVSFFLDPLYRKILSYVCGHRISYVTLSYVALTYVALTYVYV